MTALVEVNCDVLVKEDVQEPKMTVIVHDNLIAIQQYI